MSYADQIKAKLKQSDVEGKLAGLVDGGEKLVNGTVQRAGGLAHERRSDVEALMQKAGGTVNEKTDGKYADRVAKVRDLLLAGVDKVAERRPTPSPAPDDDRPLDELN